MIYLIIKTGAYRHDVCGCFLEPEKAKQEAKKLANTCVDSHHEYCVQPIPTERVLDSKIEWGGHSFSEPDEIASYRKQHNNNFKRTSKACRSS